jgi:hypothetical protein
MNPKLLSKVQKLDVSLVTSSQHLLKNAKKLQLQTVFVIGVVRDTRLTLTHVDASTELLTMTFISTPIKQAQPTGTTGELSAYKLLSKAQRKVVSLVIFSHRLLKSVKHLQRQAIFVTGVVPDTHLVLTHADAFTELLTRTFTSTRTTLAQRTGVTGELFAYQKSSINFSKEQNVVQDSNQLHHLGKIVKKQEEQLV